MAEEKTASAHEVIAVEPVIRRVIAARVANQADVDDLAQDCLDRLLTARGRLAPEAVLPYAIVTARNLASSHVKSAMRHAAAAPRILTVAQPERPDEMLLADEARGAMQAALARLPDQERRDLLAYYDDTTERAVGDPESRGALRVRMARTRAKLRLEFLLAFRHVELPFAVCRSVLLAISAGDTRRQREYNAGQHLLDCETCAALSEPLDRRSGALTAIAVPGGLAAWAAGKARAHPVHAAVSAVAGAAVVAAAVLLGSHQHTASVRPPPAVRVSPAPVPSAPAAVLRYLTVGGQPLSDAAAAHSLRSLIGRTAQASPITVVAAVTRNGFWIGSSRPSGARIWVQLVGSLRPLRVRTGDRVRFTGTMVGNSSAFLRQTGLLGSGAALLERQGAHLAVSTAKISIER